MLRVTSAIGKRLNRSAARSEAAEIDRARSRAMAALDDSFATIGGRTAVVAMVAGDIVSIAGLRRCGGTRAASLMIGWLAWHDRLRE